MGLKFSFLIVLDFGYQNTCNFYYFAKFQRLWVLAQRMPLKQLFPKQKTLTELTNTNTSRKFEEKNQNKFILVFKQIVFF